MASMAVKATLARGLQKCVGNLWRGDDFSDFTIVVEDTSFPCHRFILSACSGFFQGLFRSQMKESLEGLAKLDRMTKETFNIIITSIYKGTDGLSEDTVLDVWSATHLLQIDYLIEECQQFVIHKASVDNCFRFLNHAMRYSAQEVIDSCLVFIIKNFEQVRNAESFLQLPLDCFYKIIESDILATSSEDSVVDAILKWMEYKPDPEHCSWLFTGTFDEKAADEILPVADISTYSLAIKWSQESRDVDQENEDIGQDNKKNDQENENIGQDHKKNDQENENIGQDNKNNDQENENIGQDNNKNDQENENIGQDNNMNDQENENIGQDNNKNDQENENIGQDNNMNDQENENIGQDNNKNDQENENIGQDNKKTDQENENIGQDNKRNDQENENIGQDNEDNDQEKGNDDQENGADDIVKEHMDQSAAFGIRTDENKSISESCENRVKLKSNIITSEGNQKMCIKNNACQTDSKEADRKQHFLKLISACRLFLAKPTCLENLLKSYGAVLISTGAYNFVLTALMYTLRLDLRHDSWPEAAVHRASSSNKHVMVFLSDDQFKAYSLDTGSVHVFAKVPEDSVSYSERKRKTYSNIITVFDNSVYLLYLNTDNGLTLSMITKQKLWKAHIDLDRNERNMLLAHGNYVYDVDVAGNEFTLSRWCYVRGQSYSKWMTQECATRATVNILIRFQLYIVVFTTENGVVNAHCFNTETDKVHVCATSLDATSKSMISFSSNEDVYVLQANGSLWKVFSTDTTPVDFQLVSILCDFNCNLKGCVLYREKLYVFCDQSYQTNTNTLLTSLPGIYEDINIITINSNTLCLPMVLPGSWLTS